MRKMKNRTGTETRKIGNTLAMTVSRPRVRNGVRLTLTVAVRVRTAMSIRRPTVGDANEVNHSRWDWKCSSRYQQCGCQLELGLRIKWGQT